MPGVQIERFLPTTELSACCLLCLSMNFEFGKSLLMHYFWDSRLIIVLFHDLSFTHQTIIANCLSKCVRYQYDTRTTQYDTSAQATMLS
ncbi:hypothetical protein M8J77_017404 [Diaphorina citri]|nr:hypothetical protein M8J77_017404 [Diaphorina citri]